MSDSKEASESNFKRDDKHFTTMGRRKGSSGALQNKLREANKELTLTKRKSIDSANPSQLEGQYTSDEIESKFKDKKSSVLFRIPLVNLFWTFIDSRIDPVGWDQIVTLLNTLSIVIALVLALSCTFQSVVNFSELIDADIRFATQGYKGAPLTLPINVNANKNTDFMNSFPGWTVNADGTPECQTNPCTATRYLPALNKFVVSENYSKWYDTTGESVTISAAFSRDLMLTDCFLSTSLLLAVLLFGFGSPNIFVRDSGSSALERHQYLTVARSYFYWVRWVILATIFFGILGIAFFFNAIKYLVYLKFPDEYVAQFSTAEWGQLKSNYGLAATVINIACFAPLVIFALVLSMGTRAAHMYPVQSITSLRNIELINLRVSRARKIRNWLVIHANLPSLFVKPKVNEQGQIIGVQKRTHLGNGTKSDDMPRFGPGKTLYDLAMDKFVRKDEANGRTSRSEERDPTVGRSAGNRAGVYLSGAGGMPAMDAEVVADALMDAGFLSPSDLYTLQSVDQQGCLYELPAIHNAAATFIIIALEEWFSARQDPGGSDAERKACEEAKEAYSKKVLLSEGMYEKYL